jgi:signal transduction histidine kinase
MYDGMDDATELQALRSRLVSSTLEERRRVERALHDGVEQDLIAISVRLQFVRNLVATAPAGALAELDEAQREVRNALVQLRTLASGIYPAILDARGLRDALRQAAGASGTAARIQAAELGRYPAEIEAAVFFLWRTVLDGLGAGAEAFISVRQEGEALQVEITAGGTLDLAGARDLVEGAGGAVTVDSQPGDARIDVTFPLAS